MNAHGYLRKVAACVMVAAQRGVIPRSVTFPRKPRSSVDQVYKLASDYGDCMVLVYRLSRNDEPELWPIVAGLQPELGWCLEWYQDAVRAERQHEKREAALEALERRTRHAAVTSDVTEHDAAAARPPR